MELTKEAGFISPNGGLSSDAGWLRAKILITDNNRDNLFFTGVQHIKGAVIAAYYNADGRFISSEPETSVVLFYQRQKLNIPADATYAWVGGSKALTNGGDIKTYDFQVEEKEINLSLFSDVLNKNISQNSTTVQKVAFLNNSYVYNVKFIRRWYRSWFNIQENNTTINAVCIPIVRNIFENKVFTDDVIISFSTSTGINIKKVITLSELKKYNEIDVLNSSISDIDFIVDLGEIVTLNKNDFAQITFYCKNADDKMQLVLRYKSENETESAMFSTINAGFYREDGDTELSDSDLLNFSRVKVAKDWCHYSAIGLLSSVLPKQDIEVLMPKRIYTVCNDIGSTGVDVRNNRHYSAMTIAHCFTSKINKDGENYYC